MSRFSDWLDGGTTVRIIGLKELDAKLATLSFKEAKALLRAVGKEALQPFDEAWRGRAPVLTGALKKSGKVGYAKNTTGESGTVRVSAGPGRHPQAIMNEFGTYKMGAYPFMRPAWEGTKQEVLDRVMHALWREIEAKATGRSSGTGGDGGGDAE